MDGIELRWRLTNPLYVYRGAHGNVTCAAVTSTLELASGDALGGVARWTVEQGKLLEREECNEQDRGVLAINTHGGETWIHRRDGSVTSSKGHSFLCGDMSFCKMTVIERGGRLYGAVPSVTGSDAVDIWDLREHKRLAVIVAEEKKSGPVMVIRLSFVEESKIRMIAGYDDGVVRCYHVDLADGCSSEVGRSKLFPMTGKLVFMQKV